MAVVITHAISHLLDFSPLVADSFSEVSALCVRGEQLQADGVVLAFSMLQLLLPLLHVRVGHPEAIQQVPVLLLLRVRQSQSISRQKKVYTMSL